MKSFHLELVAQLCQAVASPTRTYALPLLAQGPWSVGRLAEELGESVAAESAHLILRSKHLMDAEKRAASTERREPSMRLRGDVIEWQTTGLKLEL